MRAPGALLVAETEQAVAELVAEIPHGDGRAVGAARDCSYNCIAACLHTHIARQYHAKTSLISTGRSAAAAISAKLNRSAYLAKPCAAATLLALARHHSPRRI